MWRSWGKSTVRIHSTSSSSSSPSSSFSCSSFKDIQTLCLDEPPQPSNPSSCCKPSIFHRVRVANSFYRTWSTQQLHHPKLPRSLSHPVPKSDATVSDPPLRTLTAQPDPPPPPPPPITISGAEQRIVVYFTSLRVVRSTFEDCKSVRLILRGFRVTLDERDVSMDVGFMRELKGILGEKKLTLPRVFIGGGYIGGAEEVRQLNETGELRKIVEGLPAADSGVCDVCGGYRFILCEECNGSRKIYTEKSGFGTCTVCNENGLIRAKSYMMRGWMPCQHLPLDWCSDIVRLLLIADLFT